MSTVAFGALATRREKSKSGTSKSVNPPGIGTYVDVLAALVPAEVLAINAVVVTLVTKATPGGGTQPTDAGTLRLAFWLLAGLSAVLYVLGRQPARRPAAGGQAGQAAKRGWQRWEWQDFIRILIPPIAFAGWAMLDPASAWSSVVPSMPSGTRVLIGMVAATALAAVTKALATHSDLKQPPGEDNGANGGNGGGGNGSTEAGHRHAGTHVPGPTQPPAAHTGGPATAPQPPLVPAGTVTPAPAPAPPAGAVSGGPPWLGEL